MTNLKHSVMERLLTALESVGGEATGRYMNQIGSEGWKAYPANTDKNNMRATYADLARAEGRENWGCAPAESVPLMDEPGNRVFTALGKVNMTSQTFRALFSSPAAQDPRVPAGYPNNVPLSPFRVRLTEPSRPVLMA